MKKHSIAIMMAVLSVVPGVAATGGDAYDFLNVPTSTGAFGLGGVNIALISDDIAMSQDNPALLGSEMDRQLHFSYMHYLGSANFGGVRFGMSAGDHGAWAAGVRYLNYGEMQGYETDGSYSGSFTPTDIVAEGTYSHDFTYRLRGGINLKMVYSGYEKYTAFALAADLGLNYYDDERDLSLSLTLNNMGGQLKRFEETYDHLPFDIRLGVMKGWRNFPVSVGVTAWNLTKWNLPYYHHGAGEEDDIKPKSNFGSNLMSHLIFCARYEPTERFYVDLGYNYKTRSDMSGYQRNFLSGFSIGAGINVSNFKVGVGYAMPHKSATSLMANFSLIL